LIHKKRVTASLAVNLGVEVINKIAPFIILHVALKRLGVERFGYAQFGISLVDFMLPLVTFGYQIFGSIEIGRLKSKITDVEQLVSDIFYLKLIHATVAFTLLMLFVGLSPHYQEYLSITAALGFILFFTAIELNHVHLGNQKMTLLGLFIGVAKIISLFAILLVVQDANDAIWYAVLTVGANAIVCLCTTVYGLQIYRLRPPSLPSMKRVFRQALPFAGVLLLLSVAEKFDMFVANAFLGNVGAGLYAGPVRIAQSVYSAVMAVALVFFSEMVALKDREAFTRHAFLAFWVVFTMMSPLACGIWFVDSELLTFIMGNDEYRGHGRVLSILVTGMAAHALIVVFGFQVLLLKNAKKKLALSMSIGTVICVAGSFLLGSYAGLIGIAVATLLAKVVSGGLMTYFAKSYLEGLPWKELWRSVVPALMMAFCLYIVNVDGLVINILLGGLVFCVLALWLNREQVTAAYSLIKK
jgi:O-antigen/teichoic acid export membrane protein